MIRSFRSRALQRYWERNDARRLPAQDLARIRRILGLLNQAARRKISIFQGSIFIR